MVRGLTAGGDSQERTRLCGPISLLAGKRQGNSSILASDVRISIESTSEISGLHDEFPALRNREIIVPKQGIKSAHQGSVPPDQERPSRLGG